MPVLFCHNLRRARECEVFSPKRLDLGALFDAGLALFVASAQNIAMTQLSILDLVPVREGSDVATALRDAAILARHGEALGYQRYWCAEHHGMAGIASAATSVVLAHIGAATNSIRIGAGGIMLPNHAPMVIAEQFGTLEALFPGRVDLGLGRAPGSDGQVAQALRRNLQSDPNQFPNDVLELQAFLAGNDVLPIRAVPGAGSHVPLWILGSSLYGAQVAAALGLPYAFASHFAPAALDEAIAIYRERFKPSAQLAAPYVMLGYNVFAADTHSDAVLLSSSMQQSFVALRSGSPGQMKPPLKDYYAGLPAPYQAMLDQAMQASAIGTREEIADHMARFIARTGADELVIASSIFDQDARKHSYTLAMEAAQSLGSAIAAE